MIRKSTTIANAPEKRRNANSLCLSSPSRLQFVLIPLLPATLPFRYDNRVVDRPGVKKSREKDTSKDSSFIVCAKIARKLWEIGR